MILVDLHTQAKPQSIVNAERSAFLKVFQTSFLTFLYSLLHHGELKVPIKILTELAIWYKVCSAAENCYIFTGSRTPPISRPPCKMRTVRVPEGDCLLSSPFWIEGYPSVVRHCELIRQPPQICRILLQSNVNSLNFIGRHKSSDIAHNKVQ